MQIIDGDAPYLLEYCVYHIYIEYAVHRSPTKINNTERSVYNTPLQPTKLSVTIQEIIYVDKVPDFYNRSLK
ncbi:hypothetical protein [Microcoleus sp. B3-D7]|uniref:hypothetical protein n=1 Tax=Microcoleus sp. B3-D7 TaxID=2818659 RepID=UPI002FD15068